MMNSEHIGIGMTSQRTRDRLAEKLAEMGIQSVDVLNSIRNTPRHLFVDEALASRAYENTVRAGGPARLAHSGLDGPLVGPPLCDRAGRAGGLAESSLALPDGSDGAGPTPEDLLLDAGG